MLVVKWNVKWIELHRSGMEQKHFRVPNGDAEITNTREALTYNSPIFHGYDAMRSRCKTLIMGYN
jgi:hypothetical protein